MKNKHCSNFTQLNDEGKTPLHLLGENTSITKQILSEYIIIISKLPDFFPMLSFDIHGITPFHYLCRNPSLTKEIFRFVIKEFHIEYNIITNNGDNYLHFLLSQSPNLSIIDFFIKKGVDVNHKNNNGETPFHISCK